MRTGNADAPDSLRRGWKALDIGVDTRTPFGEVYSDDVVATLIEGTNNFQRWGFADGYGALVSSLYTSLTIPQTLSAVLNEGTVAGGRGGADAVGRRGAARRGGRRVSTAGAPAGRQNQQARAPPARWRSRTPGSPTRSSRRRCWSCSSSWPCRSSGTSRSASRTCASIELQDFNFFSTDVSLENYRRVTAGDFWSLLIRTFVYAIAGTTVALLLGTVGRARGAPGVPGPAAGARPAAVPVRRAGRRRRAAVADDAQPAVRHRQLVARGARRQAGELPAAERRRAVRVQGAAGVHRRRAVRGVAQLPVRVPVHPRPAAGDPPGARRGGDRRRHHAAPAVPLRRDARAEGGVRHDLPAPVHLDVQRVRRGVPAHGRRRRHRAGQHRGRQLAVRAAQRWRRGLAVDRAGVDARGSRWPCTSSGSTRRSPRREPEHRRDAHAQRVPVGEPRVLRVHHRVPARVHDLAVVQGHRQDPAEPVGLPAELGRDQRLRDVPRGAARREPRRLRVRRVHPQQRDRGASRRWSSRSSWAPSPPTPRPG